MSVAVGIIGCGRWGQNYVRVFSELESSQVVGVCDVDADRLDLVRRRFPQAPTFSRVDAMLKEASPQAVVVALPVSQQAAVVEAALRAGKHVLVEKPFVTGGEQGAPLVEAATAAGVTLMVGYTFLYNSAVRKLKESVTDRAQGVGDLYYMHAVRTALGPVRQDVNAAWDLASHDVAIFSYLLESWPTQVSAAGAKFLTGGHEDVVFATLTYPCGVVGHIHVSWADPHRVRMVVVVGSQQRIVFDDMNIEERLKVYEQGVYMSGKDTDSFGEFMLAIRDGDVHSPKLEVSEPLKNECEHFLASIADGTPAMTDGRFGLNVISVLAAIDRSLAEGGAPVEVSYDRVSG